MRVPRRTTVALALLGATTLAACGTGDLKTGDGVAVDNRSSTSVTVELADPIGHQTTVEPGGTAPQPIDVVEPDPGPVVVGAASVGVVPAKDCLWHDITVTAADGAVVELDGPLCPADVLRIPAEGRAYIESMHS